MRAQVDRQRASKWTGAAIRRLREKYGLTQEAFAGLLGVTWVTVSRWEREVSTPRGLSLKALDGRASHKRKAQKRGDNAK